MHVKHKGMSIKSQINEPILKGIILVYLLLFATALFSSAYLLVGVVSGQPIPLIGLLKYLLLCVLFLVLSIDALKAFGLRPHRLLRLARGTTNFKWLFTIATVICLAAKAGLFDNVSGKKIELSFVQIGILILLTIFCFWSDSLLSKLEPENPEGE